MNKTRSPHVRRMIGAASAVVALSVSAGAGADAGDRTAQIDRVRLHVVHVGAAQARPAVP